MHYHTWDIVPVIKECEIYPRKHGMYENVTTMQDFNDSSQDVSDSSQQVWEHCCKSVYDSFQNESDTVTVDTIWVEGGQENIKVKD